MKLGIILYDKNSNYDECSTKCNYHSMTQTQQMYFNHIKPNKSTRAQKHWLCLIFDNSHPEPCIQSRISVTYYMQHFAMHNEIVQIYILLSNTFIHDYLFIYIIFIT